MLNGKILGQAIWKSINPEGDKKTQKYWEKVGEAICSHIKTYAEVQAGINLKAGGKPGKTTGIGKVQ